MRRDELPALYNAVEILERNLSERADAYALISPGATMTYAQVSQGVNRTANALRRLGVRCGDHVAILCPDSAEWVFAFFGAMKVGGVPTSLNTFCNADELCLMLNDCRAAVLFTNSELLQKIEPARSRLIWLERVIVVDDEVDGLTALLAGESDQAAPAPTTPDDVCCLNYSSGTTGAPKGIHHSHADLPLTSALVGRDVLGLRSTDRTYAVARLFFTYGTGGNLLFPWSVGATVVLSPVSPRDPREVLRALTRFRPTVFFGVPTGYASLLAADGFPEHDLSSLRLCVSAGEALPAALWERWKKATGLEIVDGIGSTENYHIFICNRPGDIRPGSSGRPVPGYEIQLRDERGGVITAPDTIGDIFVSGETSALSYFHCYAQSRAVFQGNWLKTGDKYYFDRDGYFWHAGRTDDMLKVGGIWVSPTEVENTLLQHVAVEQCAIVGCQDDAGLIKPRAYVVLRRGKEGTPELERALIKFCVERLAAYKRPRWVEFVDSLPKTSTGKLQRFRLRNLDPDTHPEAAAGSST